MSTEETILDLEQKRMAAMVAGDTETLKGILGDELTYTHTSAAVDTKQSLIDAIDNGRLNYTSMVSDGVKVRDYGDTAVATGTAQVTVVSGGNELKFGLRFTDVYVNRDGRWLFVAWQSTRLPE